MDKVRMLDEIKAFEAHIAQLNKAIAGLVSERSEARDRCDEMYDRLYQSLEPLEGDSFVNGDRLITVDRISKTVRIQSVTVIDREYDRWG